MIWLFYSLTSGLAKSLLDLTAKKLMIKNDEYIVTWSRLVFALPILLLILFFIDIPIPDSRFWWAIIIGVPFEVAALFLYIRAIKISPLSLTIPILGMTPLFILLTSYLLLREVPSLIGVIGILAIVTGTYVLGLDKKKRGGLAPIKSLIKEKGPVMMLIVALVYSFTPNLIKIGTVFFSIFYLAGIAFGYSFLIMIKSRKKLHQIKDNLGMFSLQGLIEVFEFVFIIMALRLTLVSYAMSTKRVSILFSVIFGFIFFKEKNVKARMIGAAIILIGIFLIGSA